MRTNIFYVVILSNLEKIHAHLQLNLLNLKSLNDIIMFLFQN